MSLDRSLKVKGALTRHRNVLTRAERVVKLQEDEKWEDVTSVLGLPKVAHRKAKAGKKAAKEEAAAVEGAIPGAAPAAGAAKAGAPAAAGAKPAAGAKAGAAAAPGKGGAPAAKSQEKSGKK
jgi:small basic protein (TIGR04137 family)